MEPEGQGTGEGGEAVQSCSSLYDNCKLYDNLTTKPSSEEKEPVPEASPCSRRPSTSRPPVWNREPLCLGHRCILTLSLPLSFQGAPSVLKDPPPKKKFGNPFPPMSRMFLAGPERLARAVSILSMPLLPSCGICMQLECSGMQLRNCWRGGEGGENLWHGLDRDFSIIIFFPPTTSSSYF